MYPNEVTHPAVQVASGFFSLVSALSHPWGVQKKKKKKKKEEDCISFWCHLASNSLDLFTWERDLEKLGGEDIITAASFVHRNCLNPEWPYQEGLLESKAAVVLIDE